MASDKDYASQAPGATGVDRNHPAEQGHQLTIIDADQGVVEAIPRRKKFAICGFAASSRMLAPFGDPQYEIWGLNQLYRHIPRETRHFDIHRNWREDNVPGTDHPTWLAQCGIPVYMAEREPSIPTAVRYPVEDIMQRVGGIDYFTSTVSFMLALAIQEIDQQVEAEVEELTRRAHGDERPPGVTPEEWRASGRVDLGVVGDDTPNNTRGGIDAEAARKILLGGQTFVQWRSDRYREREIAIFGIDLIVGTEYDWQKACVEFYLGIAHARGIVVRVPPFSALLKQQFRYGYQAEPEQGPLKLSELQTRAMALQNERQQTIAKLQTLDGALQENSYWAQVADLRLKGGKVKLNEDT